MDGSVEYGTIEADKELMAQEDEDQSLGDKGGAAGSITKKCKSGTCEDFLVRCRRRMPNLRTVATLWVLFVIFVRAATLLSCGSAGSEPVEHSSPSNVTKRMLYIDYFCENDTDCAVKDIGQCCDSLMACVNKNFTPNNKKRCKELGERPGPCVWSYLESCVCRNELCEGYHEGRLHIPPEVGHLNP
ncbi:hypothetical protein ACA910_010621 [Epithemia clementina (nom. ined.)]